MSGVDACSGARVLGPLWGLMAALTKLKRSLFQARPCAGVIAVVMMFRWRLHAFHQSTARTQGLRRSCAADARKILGMQLLLVCYVAGLGLVDGCVGSG